MMNRFLLIGFWLSLLPALACAQLVRSRSSPAVKQHARFLRDTNQLRYPEILKGVEIVGEGTVTVVVDTSGAAVTRSLTFEGNLHELFRSSLKQSAEKWRFEPARIADRAVVDTVRVRVEFRPTVPASLIPYSCSDCDPVLEGLRYEAGQWARRHEVCAQAMREIMRTEPTDSLAGAVNALRTCPDANTAGALAVRLLTSGHQRDVTRRLRADLAGSLLSAEVFKAALDVATDSGNREAQIYALEVLDRMSLLVPRALGEVAAGGDGCGSYILDGRPAPISLRIDYLDAARDVALRLAGNEKNSEPLRRAANCLLDDLRFRPLAQRAPPELERYMERIGLGERNRYILGGGYSVATLLPGSSDREVTVVAFAKLRIGLDSAVARSRQLARDGALSGRTGTFSDPALPGDVAAISLDSGGYRTLTQCLNDACVLRLPDTSGTSWVAAIDRSAPDAKDQADQRMRSALVSFANDYRSRGDKARFRRNDGRVTSLDSSSLERTAEYYKYPLELHQHLTGFPARRIPKARDAIVWSHDRVSGMLPTIMVDHVVGYVPDPRTSFIARKNIYASHYYEGAFELLAIVGDESPTVGSSEMPAPYLVSLKRFRFDSIGALILNQKGARRPILMELMRLSAGRDARYIETATDSVSLAWQLCPSGHDRSLITRLDSAARVTGTYYLVGRVCEESTGRGVEGVQVMLRDTGHGTISDSTGRYRIAGLPAGSFEVIARRIGYQSARQPVTLGAECSSRPPLDANAQAILRCARGMSLTLRFVSPRDM